MYKINGIFIGILLIVPIAPIGVDASYYIRLTNQKQDIIFMMEQIDEDLIAKYLEELVEIGPRYTGTENCDNAAQYLYNEFEKLDLQVFFDEWNSIKYKSKNVVATLEGKNPSNNAMIIMCAHYDTTETSPGANDDGSGVATMLAIANIFSKYSFNQTIRFIAFSGEEIGTYGSHHYAKEAYFRNENIIAVLNLETFGYTSGNGEELFILKTPRTEWISHFSNEIAEKYYNFHHLSLIEIGNRPCDHQAFLEYGYDAVQYVQLNRDDYPLHSPEDSIDKINYPYLTNVTKLILAIAGELAYKPIDIQIRIITPYEGYFYLMDFPLIKLSSFNKMSRLDLRGMTYAIGKTVVRVNITTNSEIESVFFCIDGLSTFYGECKEPPYEWKIQQSVWRSLPLVGKHIIGVYIWTKDKKVAYDEMDIFFITPLI